MILGIATATVSENGNEWVIIFLTFGGVFRHSRFIPLFILNLNYVKVIYDLGVFEDFLCFIKDYFWDMLIALGDMCEDELF